MQNADDSKRVALQDLFRSPSREVADADNPPGPQEADDFAQMFIANREKRGALGGGEFVGSAIAAARFEKSERTIIQDQVSPGERFCFAKLFGKQSP